jgi:hypothetical protein
MVKNFAAHRFGAGEVFSTVMGFSKDQKDVLFYKPNLTCLGRR